MLKVIDLPQAFYRWESMPKEFQRGRQAELVHDMKASAMRHMMPPKEILDAVDLQPQCRTFSEIRVYMLQQARQRVDVYVGDMYHSIKKIGTITPREHKHEYSHRHKGHNSGPNGFVSDDSNFSKTETVDRKTTRFSTSKIGRGENPASLILQRAPGCA